MALVRVAHPGKPTKLVNVGPARGWWTNWRRIVEKTVL